MFLDPIRIEPPEWLGPLLRAWPDRFADTTEAMGLAIALARENARQGGGPFGALVLEGASGRLVSAGVNRVLASHCAVAHAELVALSIAQQGLGTADLGAALPGGCTLVSSAEPCAMCLGAIPWAGVTRLVCGARDRDVRATGFDEGDKPADWPAALARRGIHSIRDCRRAEAVAVLRRYADAGGIIYGPAGPDAERPSLGAD
mgnify:CR=1 FL=1